jgi:hypothetical protein
VRRHLTTAAILAFPIPAALLLGSAAAIWLVAGDRIAEYVYGLEERR